MRQIMNEDDESTFQVVGRGRAHIKSLIKNSLIEFTLIYKR
jgi:hypothetical protein